MSGYKMENRIIEQLRFGYDKCQVYIHEIEEISLIAARELDEAMSCIKRAIVLIQKARDEK